MSGSNTDSEDLRITKARKMVVEASRDLGAGVLLTDFNDPENARHNFEVCERAGKLALEAAWDLLAVAGQSTASQPTLADDVLAKVLAYCKDPEAFEGGGYFFVYLDRDKVVRIIRGQEAVDAKPSEPNRG
jgi:hypothetical protein